MDTLYDSVAANLLTEFIVIVAGLVFVRTIRYSWKEYRYGRWVLPLEDQDGQTKAASTDWLAHWRRWLARWRRWEVHLEDQDGKTILDREVSTRKAEEILGDDADLNVYLKGLVSPFGVVKVDLVTELDKANDKVIIKDKSARRFTVRIQPPYIQPHPPEKAAKEAPPVANTTGPGAVL